MYYNVSPWTQLFWRRNVVGTNTIECEVYCHMGRIPWHVSSFVPDDRSNQSMHVRKVLHIRQFVCKGRVTCIHRQGWWGIVINARQTGRVAGIFNLQKSDATARVWACKEFYSHTSDHFLICNHLIASPAVFPISGASIPLPCFEVIIRVPTTVLSEVLHPHAEGICMHRTPQFPVLIYGSLHLARSHSKCSVY